MKDLHLIHSSLFLKEMFGERQLRLSLDPQEDSFVFIPLSFVVSKIEIENRTFKEKNRINNNMYLCIFILVFFTFLIFLSLTFAFYNAADPLLFWTDPTTWLLNSPPLN